MKRYAVGLLVLVSGSAFAGDPVWLQSYSDSSYAISHSTISVSSTAVATISATSRWREVYVGGPHVTVPIYYRMDGSTQSITSVGSWIEVAKEKRIETNAEISLQLASGASSTTIRVTELKRQP